MKKRLIAMLCSLALVIGLMPSFALADSYWPDPNPPRFISASADKAAVTFGESVTFAFDVEDADGVASVSPGFLGMDPALIEQGGVMPGIEGFAAAAGPGPSDPLKSTYTVGPYTKPGKRWLVTLTVRDGNGRVTEIYDSTYAKNAGIDAAATADLSSLAFEVVDKSAIPSYKIIVGANSSYTQGSSDCLTFRFDAPADKLSSVEIDDKRISPDCYTVRASSTILTLKPAFLDTLDLGDHVVTAFYTDGGRATASFAVSKKGICARRVRAESQ